MTVWNLIIKIINFLHIYAIILIGEKFARSRRGLTVKFGKRGPKTTIRHQELRLRHNLWGRRL
jgi:hypothetical protein